MANLLEQIQASRSQPTSNGARDLLARLQADRAARQEAMRRPAAEDFEANDPRRLMIEAGLAGAPSDPASVPNFRDVVPGDPTGVTDALETSGQWGGAVGGGLARGVVGLATLPGTLDDLISMSLENAGAFPTAQEMVNRGMPPEDATRLSRNPLGATNVFAALDDATSGAINYRGETIPQNVASTVSEFIPGALALGGVSTPRAIGQYAVAPGVASEVAGRATEGTRAEPWARLAGAVVAPSVVQAGENLARRVISPFGGADPARLALADRLRDAGVDVTAGQRLGREALTRREQLTTAGQSVVERQGEQFTRAALNTIGETADRATPEVMRAARERIGSVFDDVSRGVDVDVSGALVRELRGAMDDYAQLTTRANQAPAVSNIVRQVNTLANRGDPIPAGRLITWRSNLSSLTRSSDQATREAAIRAMNALDDALASTLTTMGREGDVAALTTARQQYRDFLAIERAVAGAGQDTAVGIISPPQLRSAIAAQGRRSYVSGERGDLGDLARAGAGILTRPTNSGTPAGLAAMAVPQGIGASVGAMLGAPMGATAATIGAITGAVAPAVARASQMTALGQSYLANQIAGGGAPIFNQNVLSTFPGAIAGQQ